MRNGKTVTQKLKRALCFAVAVVFLLEAWLWDWLYFLISKLVAKLPWDSLKNWVAAKIAGLPAGVCALLFVIPAIAIFPIKILGVWLISKHNLFFGASVFILAKLVGLGLAAFIFENCREKLLGLGWFSWLYNHVIAIKQWAGRQVAPVKKQMHALRVMLMGERAQMLALLRKIRHNIRNKKNYNWRI